MDPQIASPQTVTRIRSFMMSPVLVRFQSCDSWSCKITRLESYATLEITLIVPAIVIRSSVPGNSIIPRGPHRGSEETSQEESAPLRQAARQSAGVLSGRPEEDPQGQETAGAEKARDD